MSLCFVFSGTSEGRELCEKLAAYGVRCHVFVATEYGNIVMRQHENIEVSVGRLEASDIEKLIEANRPDYVIDATHPHAEVISENIKLAAKNLADKACKFMRVSRDIEEDVLYKDVEIHVNSYDEAVDVLKKSGCKEGRFLLTTGVKELEKFAVPELKDRLIVRILPGVDSIEKAYRLGIASKMIVAMEGPFSVEMNKALISEYEASFLVTKNSGSRGGYREKIEACKACGIKALIIDKETDKTALSAEKALEIILGEDGIEQSDTLKNEPVLKQQIKNVTLLGAGMCDEKTLTIEAFNVIRDAELIIGAKRMTEFAKTINHHARYVEEYISEAVAETVENSDEKNIAVVFSGDTGLCSGAKQVYARLCHKDKSMDLLTEIKKPESGSYDEINVRIIPGISSVSYMASRLGVQYSDYPFVSLHGKELSLDALAEVAKKSMGVFVICSGLSDVIKVTEHFCGSFKIFAGRNLASEDEEIIEINSVSDTKDHEDGLFVLYMKRVGW